jgi:hypothetical protein
MPLKRGTGVPDIEKFIGATFSMTDSTNGKDVVCRVTYEALCDCGASEKPPIDWLPAWETYQPKIEEIASQNYDNGKPLDDGRVIVDTGELKHLPDTPTRWTP